MVHIDMRESVTSISAPPFRPLHLGSCHVTLQALDATPGVRSLHGSRMSCNRQYLVLETLKHERHWDVWCNSPIVVSALQLLHRHKILLAGLHRVSALQL